MSKATKKRDCPAVQRVITPAECGENRISRYACPETCPFNPFSPAQYSAFSEIEAGVIQKSREWYVESASDRAEVLRKLDRMAGMVDLVQQHAFELNEMFYLRDATGRTCAGRWEAAGFPGLKNDERVIMRAVLQMRPSLLEVHRVFDDLRVEAVDLFEPEPKPFLICDRSLAADACRFTTLLGWVFPLPHYWRMFGFALSMPPIGPFDSLELTTEIVRHLGGPPEREAWPEWFGPNLVKFSKALTAVSLARREQMFEGLDAAFGKAAYELRAPFSKCREVLDGISAVSPDPLAEGEQNEGFAEARVWFDTAPERSFGGEQARAVLGRILLGQTFWRLEAMGAERLARLRRNFEGAFGEQVRFSGERQDDLAAHLKSKDPKYDRALVPPRLLEMPSKVELVSSRVPVNPAAGSPKNVETNMLLAQDRAWLDEPVPALENQTPRAAATNPALRPKLIKLLKDRVCSYDERNLKEGTSHDINWMLEELGATEITFPPPPRTPQRASEPEDELDPWPPLPPRPFTEKEAIKRLLVALDEFDSLDAAAQAAEEAGSFLLEDIQQVVGDLLDDREHLFLEGYLTQVWFALVPPGCFGPEITPGELHAAFGRQLVFLSDTRGKAPDEIGVAPLLTSGPQPGMVKVLAAQLIRHWKDEMLHQGASAENQLLMLIVLRAVIEVLDAKCRGRAI